MHPQTQQSFQHLHRLTWPVALIAGGILIGGFAIPLPASAQNRWGEEPRSLAPGVEVQMDSTAGQGNPTVDETALRQYARMRDLPRLDAEIRRLRQLHPEWTPPADLFSPAAAGGDDSAIWALVTKGDLTGARALVAEQRRTIPAWQPSESLLTEIGLSEGRSILQRSVKANDWNEVVALAERQPQLFSCREIDNWWRLAEARVRLSRRELGMAAYREMIGTCDNAAERRATIQKVMALLGRDNALELLRIEEAKPLSEVDRTALTGIRHDIERGGVAEVLGSSIRSRSLSAQQVERYAAETDSNRDAKGALLLGWHHYNARQHAQAADWFAKSRAWQDGPEAAEGEVLSRLKLKDYAGAERAGTAWRGRAKSVDKALQAVAQERKGKTAQTRKTKPDPATQPRPAAPTPVVRSIPRPPIAPSAPDTGALHAALARKDFRGCLAAIERERRAGRYNADLAQQRGWCLLELERHTEAEIAWAEAERLGGAKSAKAREDIAFARNMARLRGGFHSDVLDGMTDNRLSTVHTLEVRAIALADEAVQAYEEKRYRDTLRLLDARAELVPPRRDLEILRAWSFFNIGDRSAAFSRFQQLDRVYSTPETREGLRVLQGLD